MARIRTIKPDFFRHEDLFLLEERTGLPIRVAFAGLFTVADREGRFKWRPRQIKLDTIPYDNVDMDIVLNSLWFAGFIKKYRIEEDEFGFIPSWNEHQKIRPDEAKSAIPSPESGIFINPLEPDTDSLQTRTVERKGKEGKGIGINIMPEKNSGDIDFENSSENKKNDSAVLYTPNCDPKLINTTSEDLSLTTDYLEESFKKNKKNFAEKFPFEDFWNLYGKKVGRADSERYWSRIKDSDKELIMEYIPKYVEAQPNSRFRKDPQKFLNKKCWLDELPKLDTTGSHIYTQQQSKLESILQIADTI